jgi:hypothetical protein
VFCPSGPCVAERNCVFRESRSSDGAERADIDRWASLPAALAHAGREIAPKVREIVNAQCGTSPVLACVRVTRI